MGVAHSLGHCHIGSDQETKGEPKHNSIQCALCSLLIQKLFLSKNLFSYLSDLTLNKYLSYGFLHSQRATASKKEFVSAMISRANFKGTQCPKIIYEAQLHSSL